MLSRARMSFHGRQLSAGFKCRMITFVTEMFLHLCFFLHVDVTKNLENTFQKLAKTSPRWVQSPRCSLNIKNNHEEEVWRSKQSFMCGQKQALHLPSEIPLDRVELSACPLVGLWLSKTLSSNKWREPAFGKVALLNSTVFILWIKLKRRRKLTFFIFQHVENLLC